MPETAASPQQRKPRAPRVSDVTPARISNELRIATLAAFNYVGKQAYLVKVAQSNPAAFLAFLSKFINHGDLAGADGDLRIVVQQINIQSGPVSGVIASPVGDHVPPLRLAASDGTQVIDIVQAAAPAAAPAPDPAGDADG
jgi:hypothetical protein